ncbi:unnamed protein product [Cylindrotheca closterium]|uniref:Uncharacterized protein n=1 Tax=Cylindrotheca closterium TaxID=2856 RepID=A0AAD2FMS9_9STRA|nr:unnamed protein product [Cylindrotheca closterium]
MVTSLTIIFLIVTSPDILSESPSSAIWRNFPRRVKGMLEQQIPLLKGRMTERSAAAFVLILSIVCVRSLNTQKHSTDSIQTLSSCRIEYEILKKYYELGFEDGSGGNSRGASMILQNDSNAKEIVSSFDSEIVDSSLLEKFASISRFASIVYLYQSIAELGIDQTTDLFSFGQLAANLQHHTKLWKKCVLSLCLYNILRDYL